MNVTSSAGDVTESVTSQMGVGFNETDYIYPGGDNEYSSTDTFNDVVGVWMTGAVSLVGLAGNVLSFVVLQRAFGQSPMFYVLRVLSISDSAFLMCVLATHTVVNLPPVLHLSAVRSGIQYVVWPVLMTTQMTTVWLTVLVSAERFVAICYPLRAAYMCTVTSVRRAVSVIAVVSVLFNVPR